MRWWRHVGGILFDGACLFVGGAAAFFAFYAKYDGTLGGFWAIRLTMMTLPVALIALTSSLLRHDVPWRCWLRFALFEAMSFLLLGVEVAHDWGHGFLYAGYWEAPIHLVLSMLLDAAIYAVGLNVWRLGRRNERPA